MRILLFILAALVGLGAGYAIFTGATVEQATCGAILAVAASVLLVGAAILKPGR